MKISRKKVKPIEPDSNFRTGWDLVGLVLIMYESMVIPYRVSFNIPSSGFFMFLEGIVDLFFIFDICKIYFCDYYVFVGINFNTGYYKKGHLVLRRRKIVRRYLRTWFFLDLLATFPYSWFIRVSNDITDED